MVISEITGTFTIPFSISIGVRFWSIINETGLWVIPFVLVIGSSFFKAKQMGEDEGSASVMAFKLVEKAFYSMFFVILLFVIPYDAGNVQVDYKQYSCRGEYASILGPQATSTNVQPNLPFMLNIQEPHLPLGWGVVQEWTTGFTQTAIGKTPCDAGINQVQALMGTVSLEAKNPKLNKTNKRFGEQCYNPALKLIANAIEDKNYNGGIRLTPIQKQYFSQEFIGAYSGMLGTDSGIMTLNIPKSDWAGLISSAYETKSTPSMLSIPCATAQSEVKRLNQNELITEYKDAMDIAVTSEQAYRNVKGEWETKNTVEDKYNQQMMLDSLLSTNSMFNNAFDQNFNRTQGLDSSTLESVGLRITTVFSELEKRITNHAYSYMGPVLVSCLIALIYMATPPLIVLSGYSGKYIAGAFYTIFFLHFMYFVIDIAWYIENILLALVLSEFSSDNSMAEVSILFSYIQSLTMPTLVGIWSILGSLLGIQVIPALSAMIGTLAGAVGQGGVMLPKKVANMAGGALMSSMRFMVQKVNNISKGVK